MKKLIIILGAITLTGSASSFTASCTKKANDSKEDTGTVFIDENGDIKIDSKTLMKWYLENKGLDPVNSLKEFFQYLSVGIMLEAAKGDESKFVNLKPTNEKDQYVLNGLQEKLVEKWGTKDDESPNTIRGIANNNFSKKFKDFEKNHGEKKAKSELVNQLAKDFPYVKKDFETLKRAWINNEILKGENSAEKELKKILATTYVPQMNSFDMSKEALLKDFIQNWKFTYTNNLVNEIAKFVEEVKNSDKSKVTNDKYMNLLNIINATGGTGEVGKNKGKVENWTLKNVKWATLDGEINKTLISDLLYRLNENYDDEKDKQVPINNKNFSGSKLVTKSWNYVTVSGDMLNSNSTYFDLIDRIPNLSDPKLEKGGKDIYGFVTNSQKFLIDSYFETQKPISVNEIVFKKAEGGKLEENIQGSEFLKPKNISTDTWMQFYGFYNFLNNYVLENAAPEKGAIQRTDGITEQIKGTSQYNIDTIFGNSIQENTGKIILNVDEKIVGENYRKWDDKFFEVKNNENLLTMSSKNFSNILKYSVYDFVQAAKKGKISQEDVYSVKTVGQEISLEKIEEQLKSEKYNFIDPSITSNIYNSLKNANKEIQKDLIQSLFGVLDLINDLNRKVNGDQEWVTSDEQKNNSVYKILNLKQGIIAFVDNDGLHITKINGFDTLIAPSETQKSIALETEGDKQNYINQLAMFSRLNDYSKKDNSGIYRYILQDYKNNIAGNDIVDEKSFSNQLITRANIQKAKSYGVFNNELNSHFTNSYERFLVNNSVISINESEEVKANQSFYKFDILKEVKTMITADDSRLSNNNSWIWDYLAKILNKNDVEELLKDFFKFDEKSTESAQMMKWYVEILENNSQRTQINGFLDFKNGWSAWNNDIDKLKKSTAKENEHLPLMKLSWGNENGQNGKPTNIGHMDDLRDLNVYHAYKKDPNYLYKLSQNFEHTLLTNKISDSLYLPNRKNMKGGQ